MISFVAHLSVSLTSQDSMHLSLSWAVSGPQNPDLDALIPSLISIRFRAPSLGWCPLATHASTSLRASVNVVSVWASPTTLKLGIRGPCPRGARLQDRGKTWTSGFGTWAPCVAAVLRHVRQRTPARPRASQPHRQPRSAKRQDPPTATLSLPIPRIAWFRIMRTKDEVPAVRRLLLCTLRPGWWKCGVLRHHTRQIPVVPIRIRKSLISTLFRRLTRHFFFTGGQCFGTAWRSVAGQKRQSLSAVRVRAGAKELRAASASWRRDN